VYPSFEFLHGHGLGILAVGDQAPPALIALCSLKKKSLAMVRERFLQTGDQWARYSQQVLLTRDLTKKFNSAQAEAEEAKASAKAAGERAELAVQQRDFARAEAEEAKASAKTAGERADLAMQVARAEAEEAKASAKTAGERA